MRLQAWAMVVVLALAGRAGAQDYRVVVAQLDKKVQVQRQEAGWEDAQVGMKLQEGDRIHTGFKATCMLGYPDGSLVEVAGMSMLQLDRIGVAGVVTRARTLLKTGEVKAEVNRSTGASGDFQVKTPTTTCSVRGTQIHRISYDVGSGTQVRMGSHGLLAVLTPRGRAFLAANCASSVRQLFDTPLTPAQFTRTVDGFQGLPEGTTTAERADARDLGVPKLGVPNDSGSGVTGRYGTLPDATTVVIPQRQPVPVTQPPPLIATPLPLPPVDVKPPPPNTGGVRVIGGQ